MASFVKEKQIADDYTEELDRLLDQLADADGSVRRPIRAEINSQSQIYEQHVAQIKGLFPEEAVVDVYESLVHYYRNPPLLTLTWQILALSLLPLDRARHA